MKLHALAKRLGCVFIGLSFVLAAGSTSGQQKQKTSPQLSAIRAKIASAEKQPAFCTNCARLSAHIIHLPGYGCPSTNEFYDMYGILSFFDPDYYIVNNGDLASNPGTLKVEWYDLCAKANVSRTVAVPAIPPGGEEVVTFVTTGIVVLKNEGVTLTLDYTDAAGTRHVVRKSTKCPDI